MHLALLVWRSQNFCQLARQAGVGAGVGGLVEVAATSSSSRTGLETSAPAGGELHLPPATPTCLLSCLTRMQDWKMRGGKFVVFVVVIFVAVVFVLVCLVCLFVIFHKFYIFAVSELAS